MVAKKVHKDLRKDLDFIYLNTNFKMLSMYLLNCGVAFIELWKQKVAFCNLFLFGKMILSVSLQSIPDL